jgi:hypothetical protein
MTSVDLHHHRQRLCSTDLLGEGSVFETRLGSGGGLTPKGTLRVVKSGILATFRRKIDGFVDFDRWRDAKRSP